MLYPTYSDTGSGCDMRALVVEDDAPTRRLLTLTLEERGFTVDACANAEDAWLSFQQACQPLILLDLLLPGMDGLSFCRRLRNGPSGTDTFVLAVTAKDQPEDLVAVLEAGADDYIPKPIDFKLLDIRLTIALKTIEERATQRHLKEEHRILQERIGYSQRLESLGVMAAGIAGAFNNQLMGILGNISMASMEIGNSASALPYLQEVERSTLKAAELVHQLLAYAGQGRLVVQPCNLSELINGMLPQIEAVMSPTARLQTDLANSIPLLQADTAQLRQAIMNLVTNAAEAIGESTGVIRVSTGLTDVDQDFLAEAHPGPDASPGPHILLEITDTGRGIAPQSIPHVFDPFYTTKTTGHGLGLASALGTIRAHNGAVRVHSQIGKGTIMQIVFPFDPVAPNDHAEKIHRSGVVLVIDDDETIRVLAKIFLERTGFDVDTACNGAVGLEILRKRLADIRIVLLDQTMPGQDGLEILVTIREMAPNLPVLMMSGLDESTILRHLGNDPYTGFLQKPFQNGAMESRVFNMLT